MYEKIRQWYKQSLWSVDMVKNALDKGVLTEEQYTKIVGEVVS